LLRVFRVLVRKGYCGSESKEEEADGDGDVSGMTFEDDIEGTGMGEGDGKEDVTDQIENEEQLLGLKEEEKDDEEQPAEESNEKKQLDEEEVDKGMEMENEFEGEKYVWASEMKRNAKDPVIVRESEKEFIDFWAPSFRSEQRGRIWCCALHTG